MPKEPMPTDVDFHKETDSPTYADDRNFYKVEKWTKDGTKVDRLLYAGISLAKAQELFAWAIKHRPRIRLTLRQRTRVIDQWPRLPEPAVAKHLIASVDVGDLFDIMRVKWLGRALVREFAFFVCANNEVAGIIHLTSDGNE
jgi:hypothetical protein